MQNPKTWDWLAYLPHPTSSARMLPGFVVVVNGDTNAFDPVTVLDLTLLTR
jgi:hypothetical protein